MSVLQNKIDFVVLFTAKNANPNGDPLDGNRPRTTASGFGEISDVCIKRKIRNRLQDMGEKIFVQSNDRCDDGCGSLSERAEKNIQTAKDSESYGEQACKIWTDVRSFGQVFAFKSKKDKKEGVSVSVRGPVTVHQSMSCSPIDITSMQITKSVNSEPADKKSPDTMGTKHFVEFGLYELKGSINVQLAEITQFSEEDAEKIKECLRTLFVNDASAARPDGSMEVVRVYWWKHNNKIGQYSSAKVHRSVEVTLNPGVVTPTQFEDYTVTVHPLKGLEPEVIEGM